MTEETHLQAARRLFDISLRNSLDYCIAEVILHLEDLVSQPAQPDIEQLAAKVHQAYLDTCFRLGWPVKSENNVPYGLLSEDSKELDRASVRAVLTNKTDEAGQPLAAEEPGRSVKTGGHLADLADRSQPAPAAGQAEPCAHKIRVRIAGTPDGQGWSTSATASWWCKDCGALEYKGAVLVPAQAEGKS